MGTEHRSGWDIEIVRTLDLTALQKTRHDYQLTVLVVLVPHQESVGGGWIIPGAMLAQHGRSPEGPRPDVEGERNHRIELMLKERDAREQRGCNGDGVESVDRQELIGLDLTDRHPLDHAVGVTVADGPDAGGVLICVAAWISADAPHVAPSIARLGGGRFLRRGS